ncbi:MAG: N-6 DNA methylase, partial [Spirochaetales bacterium]|nr:N-6 DNA methylase [Spirochaetales bacterium]
MKTFLKTDEVEKEIYAIVGKYIPDNSTFEKPEKFKEFSIIQVFYSILTIEQDRNAHSDYLEQLSLCAKTALGENKGQKFIDYVSKSVESIDLENLLELHVKLCEIPQPYLESFLVSKFGETDSLGRVVLDLVSYFTKDKDNVKKADFDCANSSFLQNCVRQDDKLTGYASDRDDSFVKMLMKQHVSRKNIDIKDQIYEMDKIVDSYDIVFLKKETDSIQNFMVSDGYPEDIVCSESSLILSMKVLKALSDTGKGFLILPKATAFNDRAYSARKYLIQNHYIEAVIDVNPSLSFTKTQYVIYVLSKNNKQIRMIDAYRENNSLSSEEIVSLFETDSSENSLILSYEDINNDYSLLVTSYLNRANYNCGKET